MGSTHEKIGGKFLKIFFTHEKNGGKFLKMFFSHEKSGGRFLKIFSPMTKLEANLGPQQIQKSKVLKIKIRSAQIVGEVFFMPEKGVPAPFGALPAHFLRGPEKSKNCLNFAYFPWWANGPYSPALGQWHSGIPVGGLPCLLYTSPSPRD